MVFDYFYEEQSESYSFYRIPKMLFTEEIFEALSTDAKVLYGLLLDRISLSRENGWMDDAGRVYVYYTIKSVKRSMRCAKKRSVTRMPLIGSGLNWDITLNTSLCLAMPRA